MAPTAPPDFDRVMRANLNWLHASAHRRLRDAAAADDVTQAVFLLLWKRLPRLSTEVRLTAWLYHAVRYYCANSMRLEQIRRTHEKAAAMQRPEATDAVPWTDLADELEAAMDQLNSRDRAAILLRFFRGHSLADAGKAMGLSEDAARMRIHRALEKLRAILQRRGIATSAATLSTAILANAAPPAPANLPGAIAASCASGATGTVSAIAAGGAAAIAFAKLKVAALLALALALAAGAGALLLPPPASTIATVTQLPPTDTMVPRVYDVADLVAPQFPLLGSRPESSSTGTAAGGVQPLDHLQDQILAAVPPDVWDAAGQSSMRSLSPTSLAITHTPAAHRQIEQFLQQLRDTPQTVVTVETRFITLRPAEVPAELFDPATKEFRGGLVSDAQVRDLVRINQLDPANSIVTAPRVTVFDGGEASVEVATITPYVGLAQTPLPDGRSAHALTQQEAWDGVRVNLEAQITDGDQVRLAFAPTLQRVLSIPTQQSIAPDGKTISYQAPVLSTIAVDTTLLIPPGQTAVLGGHLVPTDAPPGTQRMMLILVKPTIIEPTQHPPDNPPRTGSSFEHLPKLEHDTSTRPKRPA